MKKEFYEIIKELDAKFNWGKISLLEKRKYRKAKNLSKWYKEQIDELFKIYQKEGLTTNFLILVHQIREEFDIHKSTPYFLLNNKKAKR